MPKSGQTNPIDLKLKIILGQVNQNKMRFLPFIVILIFSISNIGYAQDCPDDILPKYDKNKRMWGYADLIGQWVIQPAYIKVSPFTDNRAIVQKGNSFGVIDCQGNVIMSPTYQSITSFSDRKAWFQTGNLWGLINYNGNVLIKPVYEEVQPIDGSEFVWLLKGDKWGLMNVETGKTICNYQFEIAKPMSGNSSMVKSKDGLFGVINHVNCHYLVEPQISNVKKISKSTILYKLESKWGILAYDGRILANPIYDTIYLASPTHFIVKKEGKFGILNQQGVSLTEPIYDEVGNYSEGLFPIRKGEKYGYLNLLGKEYIDYIYEEVQPFKNKQAIVKKNGLYGIIGIDKKEIVAAKFLSIEKIPDFSHYIVSEQLDKVKHSVIDSKGKKLSPLADQVLIPDSGSILQFSIDGQIQYWDIATQNYLPGQYTNGEVFKDNFALVQNGDFWGLINNKGETVIKPQFDKIQYKYLTNRLVFKTFKGNSIGLISNNGKTILECQYEEIEQAGIGLFIVKKDQKYGIYKSNGEEILAPSYDYISNQTHNPDTPQWPAIVHLNKLKGLINIKGEGITKVAYKELYYSGENIYAGKTSKGYKLINSKGEDISKAIYDSVGQASKGLIPVMKGKKWGYCNLDGTKAIGFNFEQAFAFTESKKAVVVVNGKYGLINQTGKYVLKPEFSDWKLVGDSIQLLDNGQWKSSK
jgi:hypothetical protein